MDPLRETDRETRALDALIVAALRTDLESRCPDLPALPVVLPPEDERALEALGEDLVDRILAGTARRPLRRRSSPPHSPSKAGQLAGALNRSGDAQELTDAAREEMEKRIQEAEGDDTDIPLS